MAHTDACKYQVCQLLEKCVQHGMSVNEASKQVHVETDGIPAKTIQRWWREIKEDAGGLLKNEQPQEQQINQEDNVATVAPKKEKWPRERVLEWMNILVDGGESIREAAKQVSMESAWSQGGARKVYSEAREAANCECKADFAWQFAEMAIMQLERIPKDDPDREAAFTKIRNWLDKQEEK